MKDTSTTSTAATIRSLRVAAAASPQQQTQQPSSPFSISSSTPDQGTPENIMSSRVSDPSLLKEKNHIHAEQDSASFQEFDSEIRRMAADADKLIDSFRREADLDDVRNRSSGRSTSSSMGSSMLEGHDPITCTFSEDDDRPGDRDPGRHGAFPSDIGDDSMNDDLDRLEEATAAIRESLDRSDRMTESQIKLMLWNEESPASSRALSRQNTPLQAGPSRKTTTTTTTTFYDNSSRTVKTMQTRATTMLVSSSSHTSKSTSPSSSRQSDGDNDDELFLFPMDDVLDPKRNPVQSLGNQEALLLAISVVWAAVVVALVQARYCMLDEDGFLFATGHSSGN